MSRTCVRQGIDRERERRGGGYLYSLFCASIILFFHSARKPNSPMKLFFTKMEKDSRRKKREDS